MKEQKIKQAFDSVALTQQEKDALLQNILSASGHRPAERKRIMKYRKTLLIAAIITAMAIFMGCAVAALSTKQLKLDEYETTTPAWIDADGERHEATEVTKTVLSLQGLENTPEQKAAKEWYEFCKGYDTDHTIYMASQGKFQAPEEYDAYDVYSQEMVDKLDEIAKKYDLKLAGRMATAYHYDWELGWNALGIQEPLISGTDESFELRGCSFFESGSYSLWTDYHVTDPAFSWDYATNFTLSCNKKGFMGTKIVNLVASTREWTYTRSDGVPVLVVVSDGIGYLICDREDAFVYAVFPASWYLNDGDGPRVDMQDRDIEWLAEHIHFSVQTKLPDVDAVLPQLQKADAEYDAMLDADDPFAQDSYQKLRMVLGAVTEYALLDLDGDGTDECIFWGEDGNSSLYSMKDGKTAPVLTEGDKAFGIQGTVSLCENNVLKTYEEVGQAYKLYCFYTVEQGNLIVQNRLVYDIANDCFGLSLSGIHIDKDLSREEAETLLNSYREVPLEHLPIDTLPEDK